MVLCWANLVHAMVVEELQNFSLVMEVVCVFDGRKGKKGKTDFSFLLQRIHLYTYLYTCT
jgi:hypothetical protein